MGVHRNFVGGGATSFRGPNFILMAQGLMWVQTTKLLKVRMFEYTKFLRLGLSWQFHSHSLLLIKAEVTSIFSKTCPTSRGQMLPPDAHVWIMLPVLHCFLQERISYTKSSDVRQGPVNGQDIRASSYTTAQPAVPSNPLSAPQPSSKGNIRHSPIHDHWGLEAPAALQRPKRRERPICTVHLHVLRPHTVCFLLVKLYTTEI